MWNQTGKSGEGGRIRLGEARILIAALKAKYDLLEDFEHDCSFDFQRAESKKLDYVSEAYFRGVTEAEYIAWAVKLLYSVDHTSKIIEWNDHKMVAMFVTLLDEVKSHFEDYILSADSSEEERVLWKYWLLRFVSEVSSSSFDKTIVEEKVIDKKCMEYAADWNDVFKYLEEVLIFDWDWKYANFTSFLKAEDKVDWWECRKAWYALDLWSHNYKLSMEVNYRESAI